jgi:glutamate-1-semialdehyde 2,1-aminomutase/spore coat polysaccharide biosynthesis protein SpsF
MVFRGSQHDVLARYDGAARAVGADIVMRVTSDCPLIDPGVAGAVLRLLDEAGADYACNTMPPLWPHGLDCEAFRADHLARAAREADAAYDREHVTPWLRRHADLRRANLDGPGGGAERHRWTLDHAQDYAFFAALWGAMGELAGWATTAEIVAFLAERPEIVALNRGLVDETRLNDRSHRADVRREFRAQATASNPSRRSSSSQSLFVSEAKRKPCGTGTAPVET